MPTDPADVKHVAKLNPLLAKAVAFIEKKIEDTAAHAERSMTRNIIAADEGRQTWRMLLSQKSARAAVRRIDELQRWLVGSGRVSLDGFIQDARAQFYRDAFDHWRPQIPKQIRIANPVPTMTGERKARGLIVLDRSPRQEIEPVFLTAKSTLQTAMNAAALSSITDKQRHGIIETWETKTKESIARKVRVMLSDSQVAILNMVAQDLIRAEFKGKQ